MDNIYYSKRSGVETDALLDKGNGINVNEASQANNYLDNIKIGDNVYKQVNNTNYVYIHKVSVYFKTQTYDGVTKEMIVINNRSTPYYQGLEKEFFKSFASGVYLKDINEGSTYGIVNGSFFYTGKISYGDTNGIFITELVSGSNTYTFSRLIAKIVTDEILKLNVEVL